MKIVRLNEHVAVSEQITPADVETIASQGYRVIINNRPDGEAPGQPTNAEIAAQAANLGLEYHHLPVTAMDFPGPDMETMRALFHDKTNPVLAFCRSGTRCANLWVTSHDANDRENAAIKAHSLGYHLGMAARC